jgi:hypothetical protein
MQIRDLLPALLRAQVVDALVLQQFHLADRGWVNSQKTFSWRSVMV